MFQTRDHCQFLRRLLSLWTEADVSELNLNTMMSFFSSFKNRVEILLERIGNAMDLVNHMISGAVNTVSWNDDKATTSNVKRWIRESEYSSKTVRIVRDRDGEIVSKTKSAPAPRRGGEFARFATIVSWIVGNRALRTHFHEFLKRVEKLILNNSSTYSFKYLKEAMRLAVRALAGSPELTSFVHGEIRVRRDSFGIPTILPFPLRLQLHAYIVAQRNIEAGLSVQGNLQIEGPVLDRRSNPEIYHGFKQTVGYSQANIVGVLTVLSVFRVFKTKVEASLGTIVKPFNGFIRTIPMELLHDALVCLNTPVTVRKVASFGPTGMIERTIVKRGEGGPITFSVGKFEPHRSLKSGPNGRISTWGAALDALAFIHEPIAAFALLRWMYAQKAYLYICWFIFLIITFGMVYSVWYTFIFFYSMFLGWVSRNFGSTVYYLFPQIKTWRIAVGKHSGERNRLFCGKLSVVYDQAGKARVVASANWWIQSALHGLHRSIFDFLKTIPQDGTHNQEAAFDQFIRNLDKSAPMSGFDLSAATDRLPIELQSSILDACGISGQTWKELMGVTYAAPFENLEHETEVKYAVGQPMGAYSSWAMLALTHHVIVKVAAITTGQREGIINYAILGDDVVINNNLVANEYIQIMSALGLEISMGKSVISSRFTEFAKKLRGPGVNFSPIGAGAVLAACRSGYMYPALFMSALGNIITSPSEILDRVKDIPSGLIARKDLQKYLSVVVWQLMGPSSPLAKYAVNAGGLLNSLASIPGLPQGGFIFEHVKDSLSNLFTRRIRASIAVSHMPMVYFLLGSMTIRTSGSPFMSLLELLMKPFNPGFWIFFFAAFTARIKLDEHWEKVYASFPSHEMEPSLRAREIIRILSENTPELSVLQLNFSAKEVAARSRFFRDLIKDMNKRYQFSNLFMNTIWAELPQASQRSALYPWMDPNKIKDSDLDVIFAIHALPRKEGILKSMFRFFVGKRRV
jgi:hypothetical protein